jgi:hypothetical protein
LRAAMIDFYVDYVKQDSIGQIANAFLMNSDLYGIKSEVCNRVSISLSNLRPRHGEQNAKPFYLRNLAESF